MNSFRGNYSFMNLTLYTVSVSQYIQVRKLFKGGNYSRAETIRGNTVCIFSTFGSKINEFERKKLEKNEKIPKS